MGIVYKAGADSYSGKPVEEAKMLSTWQLRCLSKAGLKTHDTERLMAFFYYSYLAKYQGNDYVVLSGKRTNSGREEAVKTTYQCVNSGKKLHDAGYMPSARKQFDHLSRICKGDIRIPSLEEPKLYADLPDIPAPKSVDKSVSEPKEDELMALIDCLTGKGDQAKAFRAIAKFLIQESISIEEEESKNEATTGRKE